MNDEKIPLQQQPIIGDQDVRINIDGPEAPSSKDYDTFSSYCYTGLDTPTARKQLVQQVMDMLKRRQMRLEKKANIWSDQPVATFIFICGLLRVLSVSIIQTNLIQQLTEIVILFSTCAVHVLLSRRQTHRREAEVLERVQYTLRAILSQQKIEDDDVTQDRIILSPSPSYIAVYRDSVWQRIPSNLLVKEDIIALVTGDVVPGQAEMIWPATDETHVVERGHCVPTMDDDRPAQNLRRQTATFNPELLLSLCGNMRILKMLETPVIQDVEVSISQLDSRPVSRLRKKTAFAYKVAQRYGVGVVFVLLLALMIRTLIYGPDWRLTVEDFLLFPVDIILCFIPLSSPLLFLICEAGAISRMLATVETLKTRTLDEMDQLDVEERTDLRSKRRHGFTAFRSWKYFLTTLRYRLMSTPAAHRTISNETESIPYLSSRLLETLGAVTMLCILDDEVICEPVPTVSELYLLEDEQSTVLDLHHENGLKFEDPNWRRHLSCLKPIGLSILLNNTSYSRPHYEKLLRYLSGTTFLQKLAAHVRQLPPPEYMIHLCHEIGFCEEDLDCFVKRQTIHVVEPQLAHDEHTSDTHAQGQEDIRLRGNLKSHMVSTVILDKRSSSHQLLTRGHPALTLKRCHQYWNGKSICPLTEATRRSILDIYNQWVVENMDCVAFSYTPVSQKYQSLFDHSTSNALPPVYLVEGYGESQQDEMHWRVQENQIFLGMTASSVQPKKQVTGFIEDLTAGGIRFVYFSPRNMRRSKDFAEKIGIETDWNCAISLRPLESDEPDPHRMKSNYSDWDVKARLPHGVEAIRKHLEEVDNVPLLVSLYTDSTTDSIKEMISIFQEYEEVVLCVGTSLNERNAPLFTHADLAIAIERKPRVFFSEKIPTAKHTHVLNESDISLSRILNTLTCSITFSGSLNAIVDLIRIGREMVRNYQQQLVFNMAAQLFLAGIIVVGQCVPVPPSAEFTGLTVLWFLWIVIPCISLSMIATPNDCQSMTRTPEKNTDGPVEPLSRYIWYFVLRFMPSVVVAVVIYEWVLGQSLVYSKLSDSWFQAITTREYFATYPYSVQVSSSLDRAEAFLMAFVTISICTSSMSMLYRADSIFVEYPTRNRVWVGTVVVLLILQFGLWIAKSGVEGVDGTSLIGFISDANGLSWYFWLLFGLWPLVIVVIDETVKMAHRKILVRYYKFLRMQFDTRLGMWSPK